MKEYRIKLCFHFNIVLSIFIKIWQIFTYKFLKNMPLQSGEYHVKKSANDSSIHRLKVSSLPHNVG